MQQPTLHTPTYPHPGWDVDADGQPIHDSAEGRALDIARREQIRDAAPDLLTALRDLLAQAEGCRDSTFIAFARPAMAAARDAIAKAEG